MIEDFYESGKKTGRNWPVKWDHLPGGPYFNNKFGREENELWKKGFKDGIKKNRNKSDPIIKALIIKADDQF